MPPTLCAGRAGLAAAAAVLLTACGAAGEPNASGDPHGGSTTFCARAQELITRFESASTAADPGFRGHVFQQVVDGMRATHPPAEIASDWTVFADALDELARIQAAADRAGTSPTADAQQSAATVEDELTSSSTKVEIHLQSLCGDTVGTGTGAFGSTAVQVGGRAVFVGDFETGDFSQWSQCQNHVYSGPCQNTPKDFYGMQVVGSDARQGRYVARFELRDGDNAPWGGGERAEVSRYKQGTVHEGDERWYQFSLKFDPTFPAVTGKYFMVLQWHGRDDLPPPLAIEVQGNGQLVLTSHFPEGPPMVIGDIARGQWVDYIVHARFSQTGETGFVEVYRDGVLAVPRHARATMNSDVDYLKLGLYRDGHGVAKPTAVMWADGVRVTVP